MAREKKAKELKDKKEQQAKEAKEKREAELKSRQEAQARAAATAASSSAVASSPSCAGVTGTRPVNPNPAALSSCNGSNATATPGSAASRTFVKGPVDL